MDTMHNNSNITNTNSNIMNANTSSAVTKLATSFGVLSIAAIVLNILVIIYTICVRFRCRNRPKSELFIVSLALADLLGAAHIVANSPAFCGRLTHFEEELQEENVFL